MLILFHMRHLIYSHFRLNMELLTQFTPRDEQVEQKRLGLVYLTQFNTIKLA